MAVESDFEFMPPERPINPNAAPVSLPYKFWTYQDVSAFYHEHNTALTYAQVDILVAQYDRLKAAAEGRGSQARRDTRGAA